MRRSRGDDGQLILLVVVYAAIAGVLVTVVVDGSAAFLHRRALAAAADGAALAAAGAPDEAALLGHGASGALPLSEASVEAAVARYVASADLARRFDDLSWTVTTDGTTATVWLRAVLRLPFVNAVAATYRDGVAITVRASARSPVTR